MQNMALNNAHPHFHPDLTGNALRVYARGYGIFLQIYDQFIKEIGFSTLQESVSGQSKQNPVVHT